LNRRRREGWITALHSEGLEERDELAVATPISRAGGYDAARRLLALPDPPTGVYVDSDAQAIGVLRAAADLGVAVPGDLAVVSGEGTSMAAFAIPRLTAVEIPREAIAREAIEALSVSTEPGLRWVTNSDFHLVARESCGCGAMPRS
jgi:LacI family transcriptional regulator